MSTLERGSFLCVESQIISKVYCPKCKKGVNVMSGVGVLKGEYYTCYYCEHCKKMIHQVKEE